MAQQLSKVRILVVGGASLDTLDGAERPVAGGAGMYTAMAAWRCGASVTLYAPLPDPIPDPLQPVARNLTWLGPVIDLDDLARFEISYADGNTTYVSAHFGAEHSLSAAQLPDDLSGFDYVHLVPLGDISRQRSLLLACRGRGAQRISAGTALDLINERPEDAQTILQESDALFMNEAEAVRLFGSMSAVRSRPEQTIFVTHGAKGATVVQGEATTSLSGVPANVIDPTGAGDTFCGATLSGLASGQHPAMAARQAIPLSARMTEQTGPTVLYDPALPPVPEPDTRVRIDPKRIAEVAELIATLEDFAPYPFTGPDLPAPGHPAALDYFFATTLQQFGFWTTADNRYERPLVATLDGEERKGAFYLFRGFLRWLENDPERLTPHGQASLTEADLRSVLRADDGGDPLPALDLHLALARQYGRDMLALRLTPHAILERANRSSTPLQALLRQLDHVGGFKEDPLRKKSVLLGMILHQRPETFLTGDGGDTPPVVDYHVMRSCLRIGLIEVTDVYLAKKLAGRQLLRDDEEWAVRLAAHGAVNQLVQQSGKSMGAVDWFFFQARIRCPEMTVPRCEDCVVDTACAHRKELFQPVLRTTYY